MVLASLKDKMSKQIKAIRSTKLIILNTLGFFIFLIPILLILDWHIQNKAVDLLTDSPRYYNEFHTFKEDLYLNNMGLSNALANLQERYQSSQSNFMGAFFHPPLMGLLSPLFPKNTNLFILVFNFLFFILTLIYLYKILRFLGFQTHIALISSGLSALLPGFMSQFYFFESFAPTMAGLSASLFYLFRYFFTKKADFAKTILLVFTVLITLLFRPIEPIVILGGTTLAILYFQYGLNLFLKSLIKTLTYTFFAVLILILSRDYNIQAAVFIASLLSIFFLYKTYKSKPPSLSPIFLSCSLFLIWGAFLSKSLLFWIIQCTFGDAASLTPQDPTKYSYLLRMISVSNLLFLTPIFLLWVIKYFTCSDSKKIFRWAYLYAGIFFMLTAGLIGKNPDMRYHIYSWALISLTLTAFSLKHFAKIAITPILIHVYVILSLNLTQYGHIQSPPVLGEFIGKNFPTYSMHKAPSLNDERSSIYKSVADLSPKSVLFLCDGIAGHWLSIEPCLAPSAYVEPNGFNSVKQIHFVSQISKLENLTSEVVFAFFEKVNESPSKELIEQLGNLKYKKLNNGNNCIQGQAAEYCWLIFHIR